MSDTPRVQLRLRMWSNRVVRPLSDVVVSRCRASDVAAILAAETNGSTYAEVTFAAQQAGRCDYLIAWSAGCPVGSGELEWTAVPELKNLHVKPDWRGRGVGSAIMAAAERLSTDRGAITVGVGVDNPDARRLYERLGYASTGRLETYTYDYVDGNGVQQTATETAEYLLKTLVRPER